MNPIKAYQRQSSHAKKRGIEWGFTFETWLNLWVESGRLDQRGRGRDKYCMARFGDVGPYSPENVYICTNSQNTSDGQRNTPNVVRRAPGPRGYRFRPDRSKAKPYVARYRNMDIGHFATAEEAAAAYLAVRAQYLGAVCSI